jgi:hypothetical protein
VGVGVQEADEEEGHVALPGDATEAGEVWDGEKVAVAIPGVADSKFARVRLVVHVPTKDDRAEAEARLGNGQELLLGDKLAAQLAVDVDSGELDLVVVLEELRQSLDGDLRRHGEEEFRVRRCDKRRMS